MSLSNDSFLRWDAAQVSTFINSILKTNGGGDQQQQIGNLFLDNNIDGSLLPFITTDHLKEIGINSLHTRLLIKKAISDLIIKNYQKNPPKSTNDPEHKLHNLNINDNYVSQESLNLSTVLMKDMIKKLSIEIQKHPQFSAPLASPSPQDLKRLNDNFTKLKADLIPVLKVLKETKPLPTPTLDPGSTVSLLDSSPIYHTSSENSEKKELTRSNSTSTSSGPKESKTPTSPTYSHRFSSGTLLSMGTGKIISQTVPKYVEPKLASSFSLQNVSESTSSQNKHRLGSGTGNAATSGGASLGSNLENQQHSKRASSHSPNVPPTATYRHQDKPPGTTAAGTAASGTTTNSSTMGGSTTSTHPTSSSSGSNEPLKQLRASTDDSCLKILQQAMKRHHIPKEDWSKYVLVICYGDKERILKLAEKPVIIFKELQELGKHPAIMLRQLADAKMNNLEDDGTLYEDSRIGSDIPGGLL
ncbi:STE50 [[Candida] subhashii]|uniref:STE50 n=1 Tax=[Candida] subhashii TaxID=561895 RepID=A0A8J5QKL3_9ASCO|nr:STE50 [[Candida] subhashii]KAG7666456.1 STE50 [[Candida] subhashii]